MTLPDHIGHTEAQGAGSIFVVGYMHSGTTLLYNILARSSRLFCSLGESRYFEVMPRLRKRFPNLHDDQTLRALVNYTIHLSGSGFTLEGLHQPSHSTSQVDDVEIQRIVERVRTERDHGAVFRIVLDRLAMRAGKIGWLEKTPTHVFHVGDILRAVPNARFVEITRDPRDILASKKTRRATVWTSERYTDDQRRRKHLEKAYDPVWDSLSWKAAITAGRAAHARHPDRVFRVSYEELVSAPAKTIQEVCEFLGLEFEPAMLEIETKNSADYRAGGARPGVYTSSLGRWETTLSSGERALCQTLLHRELSELGYPLEDLPVAGRVAAGRLLLQSPSQLLVRVFRRWQLGGLDFVKAVILGYGRRIGVLMRRDASGGN